MTTQAQIQSPRPQTHEALQAIEESAVSFESLEQENLERFKELLVQSWRESHIQN